MEKETAIKILKELHDKSLFAERTALETIIPELKESWDEMIRKELIFYLGDMPEDTELRNGVTNRDVLVWLEKQKSVREIVERCKNSWYNEGKIDGMAEGLTNDEKYQQGLHDALEKQGDCSAKWEKNTPDNKPLLKHSILMKNIHGIAEGEWNGKYWIQYRWSSNIKDSDVLAWMELSDLDEQCEQKHINDTDEEIVNAVKDTSVLDIVEPKFKVGDWVASNICNSSDLLHIIDVDNKNYEVETQQGNTGVPSIVYIDNNFHLWTIQDAKDGDVLVVPTVKGSEYSEQIFIFKEIKDREYVKNAVEYYCRCINNDFVTNKHGFMSQSDDYFSPATKEQRDLLFQKMKEAGYEWDAEKKELKLLITNGGDFEQKQEWNEEDDAYKEFAICAVEDFYDEENPLQKCIVNWLKSLKYRVWHNSWKPSDEQLDELVNVITEFTTGEQFKQLNSLYEQLIKL